MTERSYTDRIWYRDDITSPQREALRRLRGRGDGCASVVDLNRLCSVRLSTLRALHRFGLIKAHDGEGEITYQSTVTITQSGRDSIADDN